MIKIKQAPVQARGLGACPLRCAIGCLACVEWVWSKGRVQPTCATRMEYGGIGVLINVCVFAMQSICGKWATIHPIGLPYHTSSSAIIMAAPTDAAAKLVCPGVAMVLPWCAL